MYEYIRTRLLAAISILPYCTYAVVPFDCTYSELLTASSVEGYVTVNAQVLFCLHIAHPTFRTSYFMHNKVDTEVAILPGSLGLVPYCRK